MNSRSSAARVNPITAAVLSLGLLLCATARAEESGQDEVTLKNGGTVRGTIVASEPGTSVKIIELGQTQPRVIPWSQVSDVEKGKYAPKTTAQPGPGGPGYGAAPPPPPQTLAPPEPKLGDVGVVRLHIESPQPATIIEHRSALVGAYRGYGIVLTQERRVCTSPCDAVVDSTGGRYFTLADDVYPAGRPFAFGAMSGDVTMRVEPGSKGMRIGGGTAIGLGAPALVAGAILVALGQTAQVNDINTGATVSIPNTGIRNAGIGLLVGGAVALGAGIALLVSGATEIHIEPRRDAPAKAAQLKPRYWMGEF